jgi:ParB family chromosome partitioning protein
MTASVLPHTARRTTPALIDVARIVANPNQPRKHFDPRELDELAASMRAVGQIQPISVRLDPNSTRVDPDTGRFTAPTFEIISGERRWRAAQRPDPNTGETITQLHALVEHGLDDDDVLERAIGENTGRKDMTPWEEAVAFGQLVDKGRTLAEIEAIVGKSGDYVRTRLAMLTLIPPCAEALNRGHLLPGAASIVAKLSPAAQQEFLHKLVHGKFPTARDAEAYAKAVRDAETNEQGNLFQVAEVTPEHREKVAATRKRITTKMDQLARAGEILAELAGMAPEDLAEALASAPGGVAAYRLRAEHIAAAATRTAVNLRKAAAIAAVATTTGETAGTLI